MPLLPIIRFDADGSPLTISITFPTLQVVAYTVTLFEARSNSIALRQTGNNQNPQDDVYDLPTPVRTNIGRLIEFSATFVDPGAKPNAACRSEATVKQGSRSLGCLVVTCTMSGTSCRGTAFAKLTSGA